MVAVYHNHNVRDVLLYECVLTSEKFISNVRVRVVEVRVGVVVYHNDKCMCMRMIICI